MDCQYTNREVELYTDCQYTIREYQSSIWTASTPVESSEVVYGLSVHQQRVVEFYMD